MYKCGNYVKSETDDCNYKDDRCCYYCDKKWDCKAKAKCEFDCWDDDKDNNIYHLCSCNHLFQTLHNFHICTYIITPFLY